ncbi:MAG: FTR1 family iron permease [Azoarcus sp.]|jgi:high-affinity iron transporter|nr:FTR1 family iron permease [Azoarcus sp.]
MSRSFRFFFRLRTGLRLFLLFAALLAAPAHAAPDGAAVIAAIIERGDAAVAAYDPAQSLATASIFSALYFERFEALELDLGLRDAGLKNELEVLFGALNGSAMRGVPHAQLQDAWRELRTKLEQAQRYYGDGAAADSGYGTFLKAILILLREGAEAALVVGALVAYLRRAGAADRVWVIHAGVAVAIVLSILTGWALDRLLQGIGAPLAVVEGVTMLAASAMLFCVSCWLFAKRNAGRWEEWIARQMEKTLGKGSLLALGGTACLAVYREGAETVLFYEALAASAPGEESAIHAGFALAVLLLAALYFLMRKAALLLPFRFFFGATSALLYGLAIVFLGQAIVELQAAGWIASIYLPGFPQISWLGIAPSAQSLGAQALLLLLPLAWLAYRSSLTLKKEKS